MKNKSSNVRIHINRDGIRGFNTDNKLLYDRINILINKYGSLINIPQSELNIVLNVSHLSKWQVNKIYLLINNIRQIYSKSEDEGEDRYTTTQSDWQDILGDIIKDLIGKVHNDGTPHWYYGDNNRWYYGTTWSYLTIDKYAVGWMSIGGTWYHFTQTGELEEKYGWEKHGSHWMFANREHGYYTRMYRTINGIKYYFDYNGYAHRV